MGAGIVQSRLQCIAERKLPESQHGFQWRQATQITSFMVRQLAEKAIEYQSQQYLVILVFVGLRKSYDSAP